MKKRLLTLFCLLSLLLGVFALPAFAAPAFQGTCGVTGSAYRDFNASGDRDALEPGVAGIQVTAYGANGGVVENTTTNADGDYQFSQLPADAEVRIEFAGLPSYLEYGPDGTGSSTSVVFVTCGENAGTIDLAVANPGQHCSGTPDVITTCFRLGDQFVGPNAGNLTLLSVPYTAGSTDLTPPSTARFDGGGSTLAVTQEVGAIWGAAHRRQTGVIYVASFLKRHVGFGPEGPGAIYQIDTANGNAVSLFTTLPASNAGEDLHTPNTDLDSWLVDAEAYDLVGKRSLGDLTMSDDDNTLYAVNLANRQLYGIPVDNPGSPTTYNIPTSPPGCPAAGDARPFAVEFYDGLVYVGVTCTAESTPNNPGNLRAYVYSLNPAGGGFNLELNIGLDYPRGCADESDDPNCETDFPADWNPWTSDFITTYSVVSGDISFITYPQPWLTSIQFDNNGDMILGLRDRFGDQTGNATYDPTTGGPINYIGFGPGDILRACLNGPNNWVLESNGSCGGITTGGVSNTGEGPGSPGGEYYFEDNLVDFHDEDAMGALLQVPGQPNVVGTFFDPIPINTELADAGLRWMSNQAGTVEQAYRIYNGTLQGIETFAKANGLGGIEALCPPAPVEIGNRVWFDLNQNGIQDPGEDPAAGVTVNLYDASGNLVASTVTNAAGEYLFTSVTDSILFNTDYVIRLDNPADYAPGGPLADWFLTDDNNSEDLRDSDGEMVDGFPTIAMTTGGPGANNHTYDFGFAQDPVVDDDDDGTPPPPGTPTVPTSDDPNGSFVVSGGLRLDKSVDRPFAQPGDTVTWTINIENNSGETVTGIVVTDSVPGSLSIVSASASAGNVSVNGQNISFSIGSLGPGDGVTITIVTQINANPDSLIIDNTAFMNGVSDTARVVLAAVLVRTGETPWWRGPAIAFSMGGLALGAAFVVRRRRYSVA